MASGPFSSLNGGRIVSVQLTMPWYGAWVADVVLATDTVLLQEDTLTIGDVTLTGAVQRAFDFAGQRTARLVGGFGGWQQAVPFKQYSLSSGIPLSMILQDVASECGEQWNASDLAQYASGTVGSSYAREAAPAQRVLRQLAGPLWWIDGKGMTRLAARTTTAIASQFEVIGFQGGRGLLEVATETLGDWTPGRTFTTPLIKVAQTVGAMFVESDNSGKLRLQVLTTP